MTKISQYDDIANSSILPVVIIPVVDPNDTSTPPAGTGGSDKQMLVGQFANYLQSYQQWLTVDDTGAYPVVREGSGGPQYRSAGWNMWAYYPPEGATSFTLEVAEALLAQLPPGTLIRTWAFAPVPGSYSWASTITALQELVAAGKKYGHRWIFTVSTWGDHTELYNQTGQPDITSNTKTVSWITSQQYLHSVYGSNSLQDWITLLVGTFANEPAVSIYDIMNEPTDPTTTNLSAWETYCSTLSGWIKSIAPNALVYMGTANLGSFIGYGNESSYATAIASMDLVNWHDYSTAGFSPLFLYDNINKPQIMDETGVWAKGHYGAYADADLDTNGLPAMSWAAQANYYRMYLEAAFRSEATFAVLLWSLTNQDSNNELYSSYTGTGQYEPINQAEIRKVIYDYPVYDHPYFTPETIGGVADVMSWISAAQSYRYPDGATIYTGANTLQQQIHDLGGAGSFNGPSTQADGPVCRHWSVQIGERFWPSLQFSGGQFMAGGSAWDDAGSATWFMVIVPTALPSSGSYAYLISPTTNVGSAAVRINSSGQIQLVGFSGDSGGTVIATSTETLIVGVPNLVMASWVSGTSYRVDVNTVIDAGTSSHTYTTSAKQFGAGYDAGSGFTGHLLEIIGYSIAASEGQVSTVNAYLTRKYSGQATPPGTGGGGGGSGTVTSVSVATANGFAGTVANNTSTPAITITTTITGLLKGNGTAVSAATSATDYAPATTGSSLLKASSGGFANAVANTDYVPPVSPTLTGTVNMSGATEVTVPTPVNSSDAVTKAYADAIAQGLSVKTSARAATTGTETFSITSGSVTQISGTSVDGVSPSVNDYILIKDAPASSGVGSAGSSEPGNGLYIVTSNTTNLSVSRATDLSGTNGPAGAFVFVQAGTNNSSAGFAVSTPSTNSGFTYGTNNIQWTQFSGAGEINAGTGLSKSGNTLNLQTPVSVANGGSGAATASQNAVFAGPSSGGTGAPTFRALASADIPNNAANTSGTAAGLSTALALTSGGTGQVTAAASYNALSPMTTTGDIEYESGANTAARLAGNTTTTKKFLTQTGTGSASAAPGWNTLASGDIPNNAANTTGTSANFTGGATLPAYLAPASPPTLTASGGNVAVNAALGNAFNYTVAASTTISNPTNAVDGQVIRFRITSGGSFTTSWGTAYDFGTGTAPTLSVTSSKVDIVAFEYVASISKWCYLGAGLGY